MNNRTLAENWEVIRLEEATEIIMGQSPKGDTYNTDGEGEPLINGPAEFGSEYPTPVQWTSKPTRLCKDGDILFCVRGNTTGRMNIADQRYCVGRGIAAIRERIPKSDTLFIRYLLEYERSSLYRIATAGGSTFPNISTAHLKNYTIPLPPLPEQRAIAHVLGAIQEAKAARQRELELERERKAALMDHLFSYGTKDEPRKQTEIGEIPESWEVVRLEKLCTCLDSKRIPVKQSERDKRKGNVPYYGASGQAGWIDNHLFDEPLLLVAEDGENLVSRKLPIAYSIEGKSWVNNHAHVLRVTNINQFFLDYYFNSIDLSPYLTGTTRPKLNKASLLGIPISKPSHVETDEIALVLSSCDTRIAALEQEAERLDELFHTMLDELMTGKRSAVPLIDTELSN